ncbi:MAG: FAD-dependent oxidoreductase [Bacilli bacterium]|nr:FAD-dependent oxidoreductase [Bacilli bacterium]
MKNNSIWEEYLKYDFKNLDSDINTDVLIIGGGIAGILTAFYLKKSNLKITLVDRNELLFGVTSKMTAKITILQDILTKISSKNINLFLKSQLEGLKLLKTNIKNLNIECDFYKNDSYLYTTQKNNIKKIKAIEKELYNLNIKYEKEELPIKKLNSLYSIKVNNSFSINIIKYLNKIIKSLENIEIYENTNIIKVIKKNNYYVAIANKYKINAKKIIFANNYPYFIKPLIFPLKVRLEKSYILYGNSSYKGDYNLINIDKNVHSIRFYKSKMIYLTNSKYISHVKTSDYDKTINSNLINKIDNIWTNMDLITNDYLPIIGKIFTNMYIITGFNTWGILSSHIGASIISSLILNEKKYVDYKNLFNPRRGVTIQKLVNSSINIYESINGYFKGLITKNKIIYYNKNKAIYIDSKGNKHIVNRKCPHMKCNLIFNDKEGTWDCPCHGSSFSLDGKVINGPSKYDI